MDSDSADTALQGNIDLLASEATASLNALAATVGTNKTELEGSISTVSSNVSQLAATVGTNKTELEGSISTVSSNVSQLAATVGPIRRN